MSYNRCTLCGKYFNTPNKKNYLCKRCRAEYNRKYYLKRRNENDLRIMIKPN